MRIDFIVRHKEFKMFGRPVIYCMGKGGGGRPPAYTPPAAVPTPTEAEAEVAKRDILERKKRSKGREASILTVPSLIAQNLDLLRPSLKDKLA